MQQSAEAALASVGAAIAELEQLCNEIELSLRERNWSRLNGALAGSRRGMHAFENAMAESQPARSEAFDQAVFARMQRVYAVRQEQLDRLTGIHNEIGERLRAISQWKQYARSVAGSGHVQRPAALFQDVR